MNRKTEGNNTSTAPVFETVVFVLIDGVRPDVLKALYESGELPNIASSVLAEGSMFEGVTVLPSVTNVAYLPMLTGQYPGSAGIPGIRWLDKSQFKSGILGLKGHRSYVGPSHTYFNADLPDDIETVFELSPGSLAVRSDIHRGLPHNSNKFHKTAMPFMFFSHYLRRADFIDRIGVNSLLSTLGKRNGDMPRFIFVPLLDVDITSHAYGPKSRETVNAYKRVDAAIGAIVNRLKKLGLWPNTLLMLSSDHGHTETHSHLDLTKLISEQGYTVFEHPSIFRRTTNASVMVSGNSYANIYLASDNGWERPMTHEELEESHAPLVQTLRDREELEWIAYRCADGGIKVASAIGTAMINRSGDSYRYEFQDSDPLGLGINSSSIKAKEALETTMDSPFPDSLEQLWHLFSTERTGDVVVTSKSGFDLRGRRELPEHHSSHGAGCRDHMVVPMLSSHPISQNGPVRTVDLFATVIEALGLTSTKPHFGRSLW